jgi:release factor glutamine methyltransferase
VSIADALRLGLSCLDGKESPRLDVELLLAWALGCSREQLLAKGDGELPVEAGERYRAGLKRRAGDEPVAYILGRREFMSLEFEVDGNVLIPRPETEVLVEEALRRMRKRPAILAEMGTGSGAVAVSLAYYSHGSVVHATDCCSRALQVARRNALRHGVAPRVAFRLGDHLEPVLAAGLHGQLAGVVANPPYVPAGDMHRLPPSVRDWEPAVALDGGPDGLFSYRTVGRQAAALLAPGGWLGVEVGAGQAGTVASILASAGFGRMVLTADLAGHPRAVFGELPE